MKTLKQISYENNIKVETLRNRCYKLKINPICKANKKKAFLFNESQERSLVNYSEKKTLYEIEVIYHTQTFYIYQSKMNYDI